MEFIDYHFCLCYKLTVFYGMQQFLKIHRQTPAKRSVQERILDYNEISKKYDEVVARQQASRCIQCGNPGCEFECPLGNYILDWLRHVSKGNLKEALNSTRSTNTFPEICGRICPQDRLCEMNCVINFIEEGAVTIGAIEAWIQDKAKENGIVYATKRQSSNGVKVAVIGSGPGGLACADELNQLGYEVTVFEQASQAGGLMMFGIPNFKLDKNLITERINQFKTYGIQFKFNAAMGRDFTLQDLKAKGFQAIFLAFGAYQAKMVSIASFDSKFVHEALPYLVQTNKMNLNLSFEKKDEILIKDKDVVVLGGGDTAMDCVRTSIRKGARSVTCVYRRDRNNMPGSQAEVTHAMEEGVKFLFLANAVDLKEEDNHAILTLEKMKLGDPDHSGRRSVEKTGECFDLNADVILMAYGFDVERYQLFEDMGIKTHKDGKIITNEQGETSVSGVFAGGDCVRGASLVVWAIRDGRDISVNIHNYLKSKKKS